jgi:uncharacterized protein (DUF58 family)
MSPVTSSRKSQPKNEFSDKMSSGIKDLLKPEILNSVSGLELVARIVAEGFMSGSNKSQSVGIGQEFSQYRNYEPGDDLRQLDWKMYARSERYFVKQADIETNITVKFMIDTSLSMSYQEKGISKLHFAKLITAVLAYIARRQGDKFGLYLVNDKGVKVIHPRFEQQQFMRFLFDLAAAKAESTWKKNDLEQLLDHHGKELIIFISDLYDDQNDLFSFITRLKTSRNEVIVFQITGQDELDLSHNGSYTFQDLESKARVKVNTVLQQKDYKARMEAWIQQTRSTLLEKGVSFFLVPMEGDLGSVIRDFLKTRKHLMR